MRPSPPPADRLARVVAAHDAGELVAPIEVGADLAWLADGVAARLAGAADTIDEALGLPPASPRSRELDDRDAAIRAAAGHWPTASTRSAARWLHGALLRYRATSWRQDRVLAEQPQGDPQRAALWRILAASGGVVLGCDRLRQILAAADDA